MTTDPITCVHIGRSTGQGPASAAPRLEDRMRTRVNQQPDADEREAMVEVIRKAFKGYRWLPADLPDDTADVLIANGWTRKREEG